MGVAALEENVTVTGASPVVDTQSTSISTTFDKETLANLPSARDYWAILSEAPGVKMQRIDVGGSAAGTQTTYFVYGTTGQVRPMVEGINSTEGTNAFGNYVDYGSFEEVSIGSGASSAESPVPGVFTQLISKSGGNTYHGSFYGDKEWEDFQSYNIDAAQIAAGVTGGGGLEARDTNRLSSYSDKNADIGGFLKKDKAWWYASVRGLDSIGPLHQLPGRGVQDRAAELHREGHLPAVAEQQADWLLPAELEGAADASRPPAAERDDRDSPGHRRQLPPGLPPAAVEGGVELDPDAVDLLRGPHRRVRLRLGRHAVRQPRRATKISTPTSCPGRARARDYKIKRNQVLGSLSYLKNGWIGTHNFKVGGEWFRETQTAYRFAGSYNDVLQVLRSGVPSEVMLFEPAASENGLYVFGTYLQDNWKVNNRLTLNLGLRFDYYRNFLPEQTHDAFSYTTAPIVFPAVEQSEVVEPAGAARSASPTRSPSDGKTVLKGNYGKYWWNPGAQLAQDNNPNPEVWFRRYVWNDLNGDKLYQAGEEGRLTSSAGGVATQVIDPEPEGQLHERDCRRGSSARSSRTSACAPAWSTAPNGTLPVAYNQNRPFTAYTVPVTIQDPGPDGIVGNADDGQRVYGLQPERRRAGAADREHLQQRRRRAERLLHLRAHRHEAHEPQLVGDDVVLEDVERRPDDTFFGTGFRQNALPVSPQDLINTEPDGQIKYTDWSLKLNGTYAGALGPQDLADAALSRPAQNWGRTFSGDAELRHRAHRGRAAGHEPSARHRGHRHPRRETDRRSAAASRSARSSMSTTCSTRTPSRTSPGPRARRSCARRPSCRRGSPGSAPR